jgi:hypothetical protein
VRLDCFGCHYYPERASERELVRVGLAIQAMKDGR